MKPNLLVILATGVICGFAGCAHYQAKPLDAEKTAADFANRTLTDAGLKAFIETNAPSPGIWPLPEWHFSHLVLAAFYYHPDLDVARAKGRSANASGITAAERPNPAASFQPGYNRTVPPPWIWGGTLDIPIETAGKRGYRMIQAKHLSDAAMLNIASTAWQVRSRVRRALLDLYAAAESQKLLTQQLAAQSEGLKLLEGQQAAGAVSANEVTQARIGYHTSQLAWHDAARLQAEARALLAGALGLPLSALEGARISFADFPGPVKDLDASAARRQALVNRADILSALSEYAASQSALQLEIAKQYPDVNLSPGYQLDQTDEKWSVGLTVALPILNQNQGAIAEAKAKREEAAAHFISVQAQALAEIDRALAGYRALLPKAATAEALTANLEKRQQGLRAMFAAGEISKLEVVAAQQELAAGHLARLDAVVKIQMALGDVEDALQSPADLPPALWQRAARLITK